MKLKGVYQHDIHDCGAACIATICSFYGFIIPLSYVKQFVDSRSDGISIYEIGEAAKKVGLSSEALEGTTDDLIDAIIGSHEIQTPFIAHTISDTLLHYVVVTRVDKKYICIFDPAKGYCRLRWSEFHDIWTGYIVILRPTEKFIKGDFSKASIKQFIPDLIKNKRMAAIIVVLSLLISIISVGGVVAFQHIVDHFLIHQDAVVLHEMNTVFGFLLLAYFARAVLYILRGFISAAFSKNLENSYTSEFAYSLITKSSDYLHAHSRGAVLQRVKDIGTIRDTLSVVLINLFMDVVLALASSVVMIHNSKTLFGAALLISCIYIVVLQFVRHPLLSANRNIAEKESNIMTYFGEVYDGFDTIKIFSAEKYFINDGSSYILKMAEANRRCRKITTVINGLSLSLEAIGSLLLFWVGSLMVMNGQVTVGVLASELVLMDYLLMPSRSVLSVQDLIQRFNISANRLLDFTMDQNNSNERDDGTTAEADVVVKDVEFGYNDIVPVIKKSSFVIKHGEKVGIIGGSGCGKTTLAKIMLGIIKPDKGTVYLKNKAVDRLDDDQIGQIAAFVPQDIFLFTKTTIENILLGRQVPEEFLGETIEKCQIEEFVEEESNGLVSTGSRDNISTGEKRRIGIARALVGNPDIIVFDEVTSNLDDNTKRKIMNMLAEECAEKTCIYITHDKDVLSFCERIYEIRNGTIHLVTKRKQS